MRLISWFINQQTYLGAPILWIYPTLWMRYITPHSPIHSISATMPVTPHLEQGEALAVFGLKEAVHALSQALWLREELVPIILRWAMGATNVVM